MLKVNSYGNCYGNLAKSYGSKKNRQSQQQKQDSNKHVEYEQIKPIDKRKIVEEIKAILGIGRKKIQHTKPPKDIIYVPISPTGPDLNTIHTWQNISGKNNISETAADKKEDKIISIDNKRTKSKKGINLKKAFLVNMLALAAATNVTCKTIDGTTPIPIGLMKEKNPVDNFEKNYNNEVKPLVFDDFNVNLTTNQISDLREFVNNWEENKERYQFVESQTGVPAELISAIHFRESGCNFDKYMHNGIEELGNTIATPNGPKTYWNWEDSAVDALLNYGAAGLTVSKDDIQSYYDFAEKYNGTGYKDFYNMNSPYIWSGTDKYDVGKYTRQGFEADLEDEQLGVAVMLKALLDK